MLAKAVITPPDGQQCHSALIIDHTEQVKTIDKIKVAWAAQKAEQTKGDSKPCKISQPANQIQ